jgi:MFS family permease
MQEDGSPYAWMRLGVALLIGTIGGASLYIITVILPTLQKDFGVSRGDASLPYMFTLVGFGAGGLLMGRLADRFGVMVPLLIGAVSLGVGFPLAAMAPNIWALALVHGVLIGFLGSSAMFGPLIADTSLWFTRRRGIAVAICASGNYLAGTVWPPVVQHFVAGYGWRATYQGIGLFAIASLTALALLMRRRPPVVVVDSGEAHAAAASSRPFGFTPATAQALLCVAGVACCVAMSMPQVHIVAYCADLGFGVARGAQMLSIMLGFGIVSRLLSGVICDRIGGLRTLLLGSALQGVALLLFLPFDGLASLFVISALFGLFQGGIVPSYAIIIREYFPAKEAGGRVGTVLMFTLFGMALGGWMSGKVFDLTGSYNAAFLNGIAWNLLNLSIAVTLLRRATRMNRGATSAVAGAAS